MTHSLSLPDSWLRNWFSHFIWLVTKDSILTQENEILMMGIWESSALNHSVGSTSTYCHEERSRLSVQNNSPLLLTPPRTPELKASDSCSNSDLDMYKSNYLTVPGQQFASGDSCYSLYDLDQVKPLQSSHLRLLNDFYFYFSCILGIEYGEILFWSELSALLRWRN